MSKSLKKIVFLLLAALLTSILNPVNIFSVEALSASSNLKLFIKSSKSTGLKGELSAEAGTLAKKDTIPAARGADHFDIPINEITYEVSGITAELITSGETLMELYVDSGTKIANGIQAKISYDFEGDGTYDCWQVYDMFATDPIEAFELYSSNNKKVKISQGQMRNLVNGKIRLEVWSAIGKYDSSLKVDAPLNESPSFLELPYTRISFSDTPTTSEPAIKLRPPMPEPDPLPNENISSNWKNELGLGSIRTQPVINSNWAENDAPSTIYKTGNLKGAVPTNDWVSSVLWVPFSESIYAHPLAYKFSKSGLLVSIPPKQYSKDIDGDIDVLRQISESNPDSIDFAIGSDNFNPSDARADKMSDWAADVVMSDGSKSIKSTIAHGSPYAYFTYTGCNPKITFNKTPRSVFYGGDGKSQYIGVDLNGKYYGFFAPSGSSWSGLGTTTITCTLPSNKNYFSLALLPSKDALESYRERAYAFITNTEVKWGYYPEDSSVVTTFKVTTTPKEGNNSETILALYPHQWRNNPFIVPLGYEYESIRGKMKTVSGNMFQTLYTYNGILPNLPAIISVLDTEKQKKFIDQFENDAGFVSPFDTYWTGKTLNKLSQALPIAEQAEDKTASSKIQSLIKGKLEDFFTADPNETKFYDPSESNNLFYYNSNWGTLIGYDAGYGSQNELNDHHFHYGYFIYAAAQVALRDKNWASDSQWGSMVKLLIKDIANYNRSDSRFPFLRNFDPYAGHSWASGHAKFADGNNQESSSEAINAWAGLILWGEATGDKTIRDLGIYLYTTEVAAINNYWFDIYGDTKDSGYLNTDTSMIWGGKSVHGTWWTNDPIEVHGINWLPITSASFYLGTSPSYVKRNYDSIWNEWPTWLKIKPSDQNGDQKLWQDILCSYYALYDPDEAISKWDENGYVESGESRAHTYQWLHSLQTLGLPDFTVTSDTPLYTVFKSKKDNKKTYVVYNTSDSSKQVVFSDGIRLTASPRNLTIAKEGDKPTINYGDINGDGKINTIDYLILKQIQMGVATFSSQTSELAADLNGDNVVNLVDCLILKKYILKRISTIPIKNLS